jgi:hypothetical protein
LELVFDVCDVVASPNQRGSRSRERLFGTLIATRNWQQARWFRVPWEGWGKQAGRDTEPPEIFARDLERATALDGR